MNERWKAIVSRTSAAAEPWSETPRGNSPSRNDELGDFTTNWRLLPISLLAMAIGAVCAFVALALLRLIGLFTNLFYFGRWDARLVSPVGIHLGIYSALV